jgi:hypothetical protein
LSSASPASQSGSRDRAFTGFFAILATATACATMLLAAPRRVEPLQLPPLVLDATAAEKAIATDRALATKAPSGAPVQELEQVFGEIGQAERKGHEGLKGVSERDRRIWRITASLLREFGPPGLDALRAKAVEHAMKLLASDDRSPAADRVLGNFREVLVSYGLRDESGHFRAPPLAVRAAYKARWNLVLQRPVTEGLSPVELQAYYGWMALHAGTLAPERRAAAARSFYEAGGQRGAEIYAIWLFQGGAIDDSLALMRKAFEKSGELRLRNMLLYLAAARGAP